MPFDPWTGWYVGANVGGSFGHAADNATFGAAATPFGTGTSSSLNGVIGGAQLGYNWRIDPSWVWGLETDIQATSEQGTGAGATTVNIPGILPIVTTGTLSDKESLPWFGTLRGRVGFLTSWGPLVYGTAGLAYGGINSNPSLTIGALTLNNGFNSVRVGWTAGGGVEGWFNRDWSWKLEYLYLDFGSFSNTFTGAGIFTPVTLNTHVTDNIVRVGASYHFH